MKKSELPLWAIILISVGGLVLVVGGVGFFCFMKWRKRKQSGNQVDYVTIN